MVFLDGLIRIITMTCKVVSIQQENNSLDTVETVRTRIMVDV